MKYRFLCKPLFLFSLVSLFMVACPGCSSLSGPNCYQRTGIDKSKIKKVAVFSFHNNTQVNEATRIVTEAFLTELFKKKNYKVEFPGNVRAFLVNERIVVRTGIDLQTMKLMAKRLGVDAVMLGEVDEYVGVDDTKRLVIPLVSIRSRMVDSRTGKILWMAYHRRTGDDYRKVLDFGKVRSVAALAGKVVGEMIQSMP